MTHCDRYVRYNFSSLKAWYPGNSALAWQVPSFTDDSSLLAAFLCVPGCQWQPPHWSVTNRKLPIDHQVSLRAQHCAVLESLIYAFTQLIATAYPIVTLMVAKWWLAIPVSLLPFISLPSTFRNSSCLQLFTHMRRDSEILIFILWLIIITYILYIYAPACWIEL